MVEQVALDTIFKSLADPTRRDILARVYERQQTISELATKYKITFAATAKHINILEKAKLVSKRKDGKQQIVAINSHGLRAADHYLSNYEGLWNDSFDRMETILQKEHQK